MGRVTFILLIVSLFLSCSHKQQTGAPVPDIPVVKVLQKKVSVQEEFVGQTYGFFDISIRARVDGFLEGLYFREGTQVKKGQLLYKIDPQPFEAQVAQARSIVAEAKTRLTKAESDLKRIKPLAEINAVSQRDLDAAIAQRDAAKASVDASKAALRQSQIQLGYTKIYAPITGLIGRSEAQQGDYVGRAPNPVVLNTVSEIDTINVRFSITENEYLRLRRFLRDNKEKLDSIPAGGNSGLQLILSDGSVHEEKGYLDFADRQIDPSTGTLLLQASFPNPGHILRPGQFAKVRGTVDIIPDAILVPTRCIAEIQGKKYVYKVQEDHTLIQQSIRTGRKHKGLYIVTEGLQPDDEVVFEGLQKISTGMKINPEVQEIPDKLKN